MHLTTVAVQSRADGGRVVFNPPAAPDITLWLQAVPDLASARQLREAWLAELSARPLDRLDLRRDAHGKPWLADTDFAFSLSHSVAASRGDAVSGWLALAWSRAHAAIGVDIERWPRRGNLAALAKRYFHPAEIAAWQAAPASERDLHWLSLWTRKEAVLKGHGLGLRLTLATLNTTPTQVQHPNTGCWQLDTCLLLPGVVGSLAWPA